MTVTIATLRTQRPELTETPDAVVQAAIDDAVTEVDVRIFDVKANQAVSLLAAHKLGISPFGGQCRLDPKEAGDTPHGTTTYGCEYDALVKQCGGGFYVAGITL